MQPKDNLDLGVLTPLVFSNKPSFMDCRRISVNKE